MKSIKILVVEDNQEDLLLMKTILTHCGYEIETAGNGIEALKKISHGRFNLIISDILMPRMDGFQLCRKIKTDNKLKNIPFIFYTASYISPQDKKFALSLGVEKFIIKPQEPVTLINIVKEVIKNLEAGKIAVPTLLIEQEDIYLKQYNERLIKKLEEKVIELQSEITQHKKTEEKLKTALQEIKILLKEIHHRVKNNLQLICSLLYLQEQNIDNETYKLIFEDTKNRIQLMALIHEKLYQSENLAAINFNEYIKKLVHTLFQSYKVNDKIALSIDVQNDLVLTIETAVPCGLILNELICNSLKYAFPDGKSGEIHLKFYEKTFDKQIFMILSDNGVGLPKGFDLKNSKSLGLKIVNLLVQQLNGAIEIDRKDGTTFNISFGPPKICKEIS